MFLYIKPNFILSNHIPIIHLDVDPTDKIIDIIHFYEAKTKINFYVGDRLCYYNVQLENCKMLQDYSIPDGATLEVVTIFMQCCQMGSNSPSPFIGFIEQDNGRPTSPLEPSKLKLEYIRNSNSIGCYLQNGGTCYAHASTSGYWNTLMRIYGCKPIPPVAEMFNIANYNGPNGGKPSESIKRLENHYNFGILCDEPKSISIRDAITLSVIVSFTTSKKGWNMVANGELLQFPGGDADGWHAALIEGYDLQKDCYICKNSWGKKTAKLRFNFTESAAHSYYFTRIFFTQDSINGKTIKNFIPEMIESDGIYNGENIKLALLGPSTAFYCSEYVCERLNQPRGMYKYFGYEVNKWIQINLHREKKHPKYYYQNQILKKLKH